MSGRRLARFRADPARVRVRVRRHDGGWLVVVESIPLAVHVVGWCVVEGGGPAVERLVMATLDRAAAEKCMEGIDLGMQWAYPHPQGAPSSDA